MLLVTYRILTLDHNKGWNNSYSLGGKTCNDI